MAHVFDASNGKEVLAYVPSTMFANLSQLTSQSYTHRYYVDGSPTTGDIYANLHGVQEWRTVLVGGLRNGGQGYFALDVTDPTTFSETQANNLVLWEFTDADDADLGFTHSQPSIVRMTNGRWAAVFGNGYNNTEADGHASTTGHAVIYILFLDGGVDGVWSAGTDYIKIDTGVGSVTTPNGLATPTPIDIDGDYTVEYIVGGDLRGNVWTFDVRSADPLQWKVAYTDSSNKPRAMFRARDANGVAQPITVRPEVGAHPEALGGFVVYFGTGKYLEVSDNTPVGATTQTFYGVWDNPTAQEQSTSPLTRSTLLQQTVLLESPVNGQQTRVTSNNTINWSTQSGWFIDLPAAGERQVSDPVLRNGRVIFTTLVPTSEICNFGGTSWLMELDVRGGSRLDESAFDLNNDQKFDESDYVTITVAGNNEKVPVSGISSSEGILPTPSVLHAGKVEYKYSSGSSGGIFVTTENPGRFTRGRQSWRHLF
jgi:type IV pilus assembly protein PilY1